MQKNVHRFLKSEYAILHDWFLHKKLQNLGDVHKQTAIKILENLYLGRFTMFSKIVNEKW